MVPFFNIWWSTKVTLHQWFSIIFCHAPPRGQKFFHAPTKLKYFWEPDVWGPAFCIQSPDYQIVFMLSPARVFRHKTQTGLSSFLTMFTISPRLCRHRHISCSIVPYRRISIRACVCLFFKICVLVSTWSVLFWKVTRRCIFISALDFLSTRCKIQLNCCVMLRHPPDIEVLHICSGGLRNAGAGTEQISSEADLLKVKTQWNLPVQRTRIQWK